MNAKARLQEVQDALMQRGVRDVKFFFGHDARFNLPSVLQADVAEVMDKYLNGRVTKVEDFNDEVLPAAI